MKKVFLLAIVIIAATSDYLFAQKVDLDRYSFSLGGMYQLPTEPFPEDYKTFNVKSKRIGNTGIFPNSIEERVNIGGWNKLENDVKAHLSIEISFDNLIIDKSEIKEAKSESKDKAGKVTTTYSYTVAYQYSMGASHKITDYNGKTHPPSSYFKPSGTFTSSTFSTYAAASNYKNDNNAAFRDRFVNELVDKYTGQLSRDMTVKWGLLKVSVNSHFWIMDSKKHPEQDSMQICAKFMKEKMPMYNVNMTSSEFKEIMMPFIGYFERLATRYKADEKADKKLRYSSYYNLATLYYYLDDLDKSDVYADLLIKNDYDPGDGESMKKDNVILRQVFKKAKINKRHLSFDASTFMGPK